MLRENAKRDHEIMQSKHSENESLRHENKGLRSVLDETNRLKEGNSSVIESLQTQVHELKAMVAKVKEQKERDTRALID